jgi:hypothetical protein
MTNIPPVSGSTPPSLPQPQNIHVLAAVAFLLAELAQLAPATGKLPKAA